MWNGYIIGLMEYAQAIWFTSSNQDQAFVRSVGLGKFFIAEMIWSEGATPFGVNLRPANSMVSIQNLNFLSLITIPAVANKCK